MPHLKPCVSRYMKRTSGRNSSRSSDYYIHFNITVTVFLSVLSFALFLKKKF